MNVFQVPNGPEEFGFLTAYGFSSFFGSICFIIALKFEEAGIVRLKITFWGEGSDYFILLDHQFIS